MPLEHYSSITLHNLKKKEKKDYSIWLKQVYNPLN